VLRDEPLELTDELGVAPESEVGLDPQLCGSHPEIVEPRCGRTGERLALEPGKRPTAPQIESLAEQGPGPSRIPSLEGLATPLEEILEDVEVDLLALDPEGVTPWPGLEQSFAELPAEA
jgi:hypothetical protein